MERGPCQGPRWSLQRAGRHRRVQEVLITQSSVRSAFSQPAAAAEGDQSKQPADCCYSNWNMGTPWKWADVTASVGKGHICWFIKIRIWAQGLFIGVRRIKVNKKQGEGNINNNIKDTSIHEHLHLLSFSPWSCSSPCGWPSFVSAAARALLLCGTPGQIRSGSYWSDVCWPHVQHKVDGPGRPGKHETYRCEAKKKQHITVRTFLWQEYMIHGKFSQEK